MFYNVLVLFPENTELYLQNKRKQENAPFNLLTRSVKRESISWSSHLISIFSIKPWQEVAVIDCENKKKTILIKKVLQPNWGIPIVCCASVKAALWFPQVKFLLAYFTVFWFIDLPVFRSHPAALARYVRHERLFYYSRVIWVCALLA